MIAGPLHLTRLADFRFRAAGIEEDALRVTEFDGCEGISELYDLRIRLCGRDANLSLDRMLGAACTLEIASDSGTRFVHGIVRRFERLGHGVDWTYYEANLVPMHWLLTKRVRSRIFQKPRCEDTTLPGILRKVFADAGIPSEAVHIGLIGKYDEREFTVQYRESDMDFISRLMEEEGAYYYFEHTADGYRMVVADDHSLHAPFAPESRVPYREANHLLPEQEHVFGVRDGREIQIGAVSLDDFNFTQPGHDLRVDAAAKQFTALRWADYPGDYAHKGLGKRLAEIRLAEQQAARHVVTMSATLRSLRPATRFELIDHPAAATNAEYLVTHVAHRATQSAAAEAEDLEGEGCRYEAEVRVIPAAVQYRPPRVTPRPTVRGSQTAIVTGPAGEEIHTDAYGRVKVRFHWDEEAAHDENASCWIRVSHGMAGGQYGMMFLPRVGQEVIVDFLEGDPDRPIITGRVYNNDHMPPYKLPDEKTISAIRTCSTPGADGGNEIRFDDAKGKEQLLLHAQNSLHVRSRGSHFENIGRDRHLTVGASAYELVRESKHSTINLDRLENVKGNVHLRVEQDVKEMVSGRKTTYVGKKYAILNSEGVVVESDTGITLKCKGNFIKIDADGVTILGTKVKINSGGLADTWTWDSPDPCTLPKNADTIRFGHNTTYAAAQAEDQKIESAQEPSPPGESSIETLRSWIEIELIDDLGRPCRGEAYEVIEPDGTVHRGSLDAKGLARVGVKQPGECRVGFPRLDGAVWDRDAVASALPGNSSKTAIPPASAPMAVPAAPARESVTEDALPFDPATALE